MKLSHKISLYLLPLFAVVFFSPLHQVEASIVKYFIFDNYNSGSLNGQDGWISEAGYSVVSAPYGRSGKAISSTGNVMDADRQFITGTTTATNLYFSGYFAVGESLSVTQPLIINVDYSGGAGGDDVFGLEQQSSGALHFNATGGSQIVANSLAINTWYSYLFEWDVVGNRIRILEWNGSATSAPYMSLNHTGGSMNFVSAHIDSDADSQVDYFDDILVEDSIASTTSFIGDETRIVDLNTPAYRGTYTGTTTIPFSFDFYQSENSATADSYKFVIRGSQSGTVQEFTGSLTGSDLDPGVHTLSTRYLTISTADQYSCELELLGDVTLAFVGLVEDYQLDRWFGECLFNFGVSRDFPSYTDPLDFGQIDDSTSTTTPSAITERLQQFTEDITSRFPFSWYFQTLALIKTAALYQQDYETIDITFDLAPQVTSATSSGRWVNSYATKQALASSSGTTSLSSQPIEAGCDFLERAADGICSLFRNLSSYMMWIGLIVAIGLMFWGFFKPSPEV